MKLKKPQKKSAKTGKNFIEAVGGGIFFGWPEYIPLCNYANIVHHKTSIAGKSLVTRIADRYNYREGNKKKIPGTSLILRHRPRKGVDAATLINSLLCITYFRFMNLMNT